MIVRPVDDVATLVDGRSAGNGLSSFSSGRDVAAAFDASAAPKNAADASEIESVFPDRELVSDELAGGVETVAFAAAKTAA